MSPEIYTTGKIGRPINIRTLPGESKEAFRAAAVNKTIAASDCLVWVLEHGRPISPYRERALRYLNNLGMPEEFSEQLIDGALKGIEGLSVVFDTVFENSEEVGGKRHYENFTFVDRREQK